MEAVDTIHPWYYVSLNLWELRDWIRANLCLPNKTNRTNYVLCHMAQKMLNSTEEKKSLT